VLLDASTEQRLAGDDTECTVLILDEDNAGIISFDDTVMEVARKDEVAYVMIKRVDGSDGIVSCTASTSNELDTLPGKRAGIPNVDFVPF